jgi:NAD(P)-dependent dehydrogenase (short-subunit alcohol dehydrogenase family)
MNLRNDIKNILLIGASGGIAQACLKILLETESVKSLMTVSRSSIDAASQNPDYQKLDSHVVADYDETTIQDVCQSIKPGSLDLVICTLGVLHVPDSNGDQALDPEKKIEDLNARNLQHYFSVNSIIPALWLKHLVNKMNTNSSHIILLSARVGSISDNQLGGWYGYRASKSALNMLVKTAQVEYRRRCPGCDLVLYHPGTVDTPLSKPFQRNVQPHKLFTPEFTASRLFDIPDNKPNTAAPYYLDWQHQTIEW